MQICIHWKDNSPKPVNHRLALKEGPKVKSKNSIRDARTAQPREIFLTP